MIVGVHPRLIGGHFHGHPVPAFDHLHSVIVLPVASIPTFGEWPPVRETVRYRLMQTGITRAHARLYVYVYDRLDDDTGRALWFTDVVEHAEKVPGR